MPSYETTKTCGKCLNAVPCVCRSSWETDPAIPENVKQFIRAYAVIAKVA